MTNSLNALLSSPLVAKTSYMLRPMASVGGAEEGASDGTGGAEAAHA